ncbi:Rv3235 family protein [Actinomadura meyerae]|uniref:Rv3235 family protein n=1 Tax=Actinomadura meyerae TaxID=240840 RepID=UPI00117888A6|nr:Rv3235 family protein [Actinomadura meyerae]
MASSEVRVIRYRPEPATRKAPAPPGPGLRVVRPGDGVEAEVRAVADTAVRLVVEVLAGARPAHQLSLVAVPAVCRAFAPPPGAGARGRRVVPPKVLSTRMQRPSPAVAEATAVVVVAGRVHALALRLELARGRWRCTALETTAP